MDSISSPIFDDAMIQEYEHEKDKIQKAAQLQIGDTVLDFDPNILQLQLIENDILHYFGQTYQGNKHGFGILKFKKNIEKYTGFFFNDVFFYYGHYLQSDQSIYEGFIQNGAFLGKGTLKLNNGTVIQGEFQNSIKCNGTITYPQQNQNNQKYEGDIVNMKKHGDGKLFNNNQLIYEGSFDSDQFHGNGKLYQNNQLIYEGQFAQGVKHGKGFNYINNQKFEVVFEQGIHMQDFQNFKQSAQSSIGSSIYNQKQSQYVNQIEQSKIAENQKNVKEQSEVKIEKKTLVFPAALVENKIVDNRVSVVKQNIVIQQNIRYLDYTDWKLEHVEIKNNQQQLIYVGQIDPITKQKNGFGILYNIKGFIEYQGEWIKDKYYGFGEMYNENNQKQFEGCFVNGIEQGYCKSFINGVIPDIQGYMLFNKKFLHKFDCSQRKVSVWRKHLLMFKDYIYEGEIDSNNKQFNGKGKLINEQGDKIYEGNFKNGIYSGHGELYFSGNKLKYEGYFKNGEYYGQGKLYFENGKLYYEGQFQNGIKHGEGKEFNDHGKLIQKGRFQNDKLSY